MDSARSCEQRELYVPSWGPERYIVPLLRERICDLFAQFGGRVGDSRRVLDVGCGAQPFRPMIEASGCRYASLDVVQNAKGTVDYIGPLDASLPEDLSAQPPFDLLLCTEVLEHVADWGTAFVNFTRLLAPGGRVILTCPHFYPLHEVPYDFWRPTPHAIAHFAENCGMRVLHLEQAGGPWEVLGTLLAETHCYPRSGSMIDRMVAKIGRALRSVVIRGLQSPWWQSRVALRGPYYLSNLAVLEVAR